MATKGPSYQYGNTKGSNGKGKPTKHIGYAWAKDFGNGLLDSHFTEHGKEFGFKTKEEYANHAVHFANQIDRKNFDSVVDKKGTTYKWDKRTGVMVEVNKKGIIISYRHTGGSLWYYNKKGEKTWVKTTK